MDVVLTSYKLNLSSSSEHETSLVTENNEEIETQLDRLKKQNFFLSKRIEEKDKELEKLQLSIVMLRSKVESLEKEVDETYNLLNLCTKTNEELKKQLSASKSEENQKSKLDDFSAQFQSPLSTKSASLPSKHLFHDNITSSPQNSSFSNRCLTDDIVHCKSPSPSSESLKLYSTPKVTGHKNKSGIVNTPSTKGCTANISEQKINKKKDKGKKKLIKHSLYDYDSDDYANDLKMDGSTKQYDDFTAFTMSNSNGHEEKMFYLCYGCTMKYEEWKYIRNLPTKSRFITKLCTTLYGERELVLRAVDLQRAELRKGRTSPRKAVSPKKAGILRKCYLHYLLKKNTVTKSELRKLKNNELSKESAKKITRKLNEWISHLSNAINYVYNQEKAKAKDIERDSGSEAEGKKKQSDISDYSDDN